MMDDSNSDTIEHAMMMMEDKDIITTSGNIIEHAMMMMEDKDIKTTTNSNIIEHAMNLKDKGCKLYVSNNTEMVLLSMNHYSKSLDHLNTLISTTSEEDKQVVELKLKLFLNIAQCYVILKDWDNVIENCNYALKIDDTNSKALYRRACAFEARNQYDLSLSDLEEALRSSNDIAIKDAIHRVKINSNRQSIVSKHEPLLFNSSELIDITVQYCKARGLGTFETHQQVELTKRLLQFGDTNEINYRGKVYCSVLKRNYITKDKELTDMSVRELKETTIRTGLDFKSKLFTTKSEYVTLLNKYLEENPVIYWSEEEIMEQAANESIRRAKISTQAKQFDSARQQYESALNCLEVQYGLDDIRTIQTSIDYATVLFEISISNGVDKDLLSSSSKIYNSIINRMLAPLGNTNEYVIKCYQCLRRNSHVVGNYNNDSSITYNKNFIESHLQLLCHPAVMTDMIKGRLFYIIMMKKLNNDHDNDQLLQLRNELNHIIDLVKHPTYCELKISTIFNKNNLDKYNEEVLKYMIYV